MKIKKQLDIAIVWLVSSILTTLVYADEPNDYMSSRTILPPGVMTISDSITGGNGQPDTVLGAFDDASFTTIIATDDFSSPLGDGFASGLFAIPVNADGSIHLKVSGWDDFDFDGFSDLDHTGSYVSDGDFDLHVKVYDSSGSLIDTLPIITRTLVSGNFTTPGSVEAFSFQNNSYIGGSFDAYIDNTRDRDPYDFWEFSGLTAGASYIAEITCCTRDNGGFDTELGWFSDSGDPLVLNDDGGTGLLSAISGTIPADGRLIMVVTGFLGFERAHKQNGDYTLRISEVPSQPDGDCAPLGSPDGNINAADYLVCMRIALGELPPTLLEKAHGDLNFDGLINTSDLVLLLDIIQTVP